MSLHMNEAAYHERRYGWYHQEREALTQVVAALASLQHGERNQVQVTLKSRIDTWRRL